MSESSRSSLSGIIQENYLPVWQARNMDAEFPWILPADLKDAWVRNVKDGSINSLAAAIMLSRSAGLDDDTRAFLETYYLREMGDPPIPADTLAAVLLAGATPPWRWIASFLQFANQAISSARVELLWKSLRHPDAPVPLIESSQSPLRFPASLHPDADVPDDPWGQAAASLCGKCAPPETELGRMAGFLLCNVDSVAITDRIQYTPVPLIFTATSHPGRSMGPSPPVNPRCPSMEAIRYFTSNYSVCAIHRYLHPLLVQPWQMTVIEPPQTWGALACIGLAGAPIALFRDPVETCVPWLSELLRSHPSQNLLSADTVSESPIS